MLAALSRPLLPMSPNWLARVLYEGGAGKGALSGGANLILRYPITALSF